MFCQFLLGVLCVNEIQSFGNFNEFEGQLGPFQKFMPELLGGDNDVRKELTELIELNDLEENAIKIEIKRLNQVFLFCRKLKFW